MARCQPARSLTSSTVLLGSVSFALAGSPGSSRLRHAVAKTGVRGDLQQSVVFGGAFTASRGAGLQVTAPGADGQIRDEAVLDLPGTVGDELPVPGLAGRGDAERGDIEVAGMLAVAPAVTWHYDGVSRS